MFGRVTLVIVCHRLRPTYVRIYPVSKFAFIREALDYIEMGLAGMETSFCALVNNTYSTETQSSLFFSCGINTSMRGDIKSFEIPRQKDRHASGVASPRGREERITRAEFMDKREFGRICSMCMNANRREDAKARGNSL